jgi:hypothetical protein
MPTKPSGREKGEADLPQRETRVALEAGLGVCLGAAVGAAMGNVAMGVAMGIVFGTALGVSLAPASLGVFRK